jgi:ribose 5-phosphate isomerase A
MTAAAEPRGVEAAAAAAVRLVPEGAAVGLGTGRAAARFIALLGARVRGGLRVTGVATSLAAARLAAEAGIPLVDLGDRELDLTVDGADEIAPNLDLIKGRGGAMVRERVVAAASKRQVIVAGSGKLVRRLGEKGLLPVEIAPAAVEVALNRLEALALRAVPRPDPTENGNLLLDCSLPGPLADPRALDAAIRAIPGVVDTGFFFGTAERALIGHDDGRVETMLREDARR